MHKTRELLQLFLMFGDTDGQFAAETDGKFAAEKEVFDPSVTFVPSTTTNTTTATTGFTTISSLDEHRSKSAIA